MVKILLISLLLLTKVTLAQVIDNFDDGDFYKNPSWQGDVNYFAVNAQKQLQSAGQNLANQNIFLSTENSLALNTSWVFFVQLNFNPTTTNVARIYLTSNQQNLKGALNGYFIQIGETGSNDGIHLYKQTNSTTSRIVTGPQKPRGNANIFKAKIKVTRDALGKWEVFSDVNGGTNFVLEGSVVDNTYNSSSYFGVLCKYATASRYNQFIFDDFLVEDLSPDITPPVLKSINPLDSKHLELSFSKILEPSSALLLSNYKLSNNYGNPALVEPTLNPLVYRLTFDKELITGNYNLLVNGIKDKKGNVIAPNSALSFFYIKPYSPKFGDVVINEIFANPTGSSGLPQKEFIELWNTSKEYLLTQGWKYSDQTSVYTFLTDTIKPNDYIILCARADTNLFKPFGKTIGLSPWPSLNNDQDILTLIGKDAVLLDQVAYYDTWYKDDLKKKGGYSLELIDPRNICTGLQNWMASNDLAGGTPGKQNSVYRSQISSEMPRLLSWLVQDSLTLLLNFSKPVDSLTASNKNNYNLNNGFGNPQSVLVPGPLFNAAILKFPNPLQPGLNFALKVNGLIDCAGNLIAANNNTAEFFIAKKPVKGDVLISEVLFNPKPNEVDFVEIYNNSNDILDLKDLQLANIDANGNWANKKNVSAANSFIRPGQYWVLTTKPEFVKASYYVENPNNFTEMSALPAFNNDKGTVILLSKDLVLDRLDYVEKMHMALLKNFKGVSLERLSFAKDANEAGNFISAAASVGFATPTYKNSQQVNGTENYVRLVNKTFSPDGDGFEDVLQLEYKLSENASLATINIYTDKGILVRKLLKNQSLGTAGSFIWDGLNEAGGFCNVGIYVIVFDSFDLRGNIKRYKNTCVLATKLN